MNAPRCDAIAYINYLIASPRTVTCTEAARVQPVRQGRVRVDAADHQPENPLGDRIVGGEKRFFLAFEILVEGLFGNR